MSAQPRAPKSDPPERPARILAKSIHRELRQEGWSPEEVMRIATELLGLVTEDICANKPVAPR